ncbi:MAG: SpoIID/LytB domain-containing protein [Actinomycetota bacterium]
MRLRALLSLAAVLVVLAVTPIGPAGATSPNRVRFTAPAGETLLVHGAYPPVQSSCVDPYQPLLHSRHRGTIEVGRDADGSLFVIAELDFEDYLKGIAEVPRDWPMEALKAQVVAARTYALSRFPDQRSPTGYDLCATDACQVYRGVGVEGGPWGNRWVRAVEATTGQALLHEGSPATTFYFSTSNGRTYGNQEVFGGAPLPYLREIRERDDGESPLSQWTATFPLADLRRFLAASGRAPGGPIQQIEQRGDRIVIEGGGRIVLTRSDLRGVLNEEASCLEPGRYPGSEPGGYRLPQTVPSVWYRARQDGERLVLQGRGWGHGVGMVQWGAKGKADRGLRYDQILGAYYGGLRPQAVTTPGSIRILVAEGLQSLKIVPSGEGRVRFPGTSRFPTRVHIPRAPWSVTGGQRLHLRHGNAPPPLLEPPAIRSTPRIDPAEPFRIRLSLPTTASVHFEFFREGETVFESRARPYGSGDHRAAVPVPNLEPGPYRFRAVASDGVDTVRTPLRRVELLSAGPTPGPSPSPTPGEQALPAPEDGLSLPYIAILAGGVALLLAVAFAARRGRRLHTR